MPELRVEMLNPHCTPLNHVECSYGPNVDVTYCLGHGQYRHLQAE